MPQFDAKSFIRGCLPSGLRYLLLRLLGMAIRFDGPRSSWHEATTLAGGYDADLILDKVLNSTLSVKRGEAVYERDSILFDNIEYSWPVLSGLLWGAAKNGGRLDVLDFGGALGSSYFQNRAFLDRLEHVRWNVVEQAHFAGCGRRHIQDHRLRFYPSISDCVMDCRPNVVLLSSVLQYMENPLEILTNLASMAVDCLIIDRTIINRSTTSRLYVQHVPKHIYEASYPCWSLSENALRTILETKQYECISEFTSLPFPALRAIKSEFKGYIYIQRARTMARPS